MRRITSSLVAAGTVAGLVGAVVAYQSTVSGPTAAHPVAAPAAAAEPPVVTTRLLPCEDGTKLVKGVCVRTKHRVVVREIAPVPAAATTGTRSGGERPRSRGDDNDGSNGPRGGTNKPRDDDSPGYQEEDDDREDREDRDEDESEDHESDDHESEDREDREDDESDD